LVEQGADIVAELVPPLIKAAAVDGTGLRQQDQPVQRIARIDVRQVNFPQFGTEFPKHPEGGCRRGLHVRGKALPVEGGRHAEHRAVEARPGP